MKEARVPFLKCMPRDFLGVLKLCLEQESRSVVPEQIGEEQKGHAQGVPGKCGEMWNQVLSQLQW